MSKTMTVNSMRFGSLFLKLNQVLTLSLLLRRVLSSERIVTAHAIHTSGTSCARDLTIANVWHSCELLSEEGVVPGGLRVDSAQACAGAVDKGSRSGMLGRDT